MSQILLSTVASSCETCVLSARGRRRFHARKLRKCELKREEIAAEPPIEPRQMQLSFRFSWCLCHLALEHAVLFQIEKNQRHRRSLGEDHARGGGSRGSPLVNNESAISYLSFNIFHFVSLGQSFSSVTICAVVPGELLCFRTKSSALFEKKVHRDSRKTCSISCRSHAK